MSNYNIKYPRTYHFDWSKGTTSDDRIAKEYDNLIGSELVISEKLDGSNTKQTSIGVFARSNAAPTENNWDREMWNIWHRIKNDIPENTQIFGESLYAIHSIQYKAIESYYHIFGIIVEDEWLSWDDVEEYAFLLDLPTVPVLKKCIVENVKELKETTFSLTQQPSVYDSYDIQTGEKCNMEGIVCRVANSFNTKDFSKNVMKIVREKHVKTDIHWKTNWKRQPLKWELEKLEK